MIIAINGNHQLSIRTVDIIVLCHRVSGWTIILTSAADRADPVPLNDDLRRTLSFS